MLSRARLIQRLVIFAIFSFLLFVGSQRIPLRSNTVPSAPSAPSPARDSSYERQVQFWKNLHNLLESNSPATDPPERLKKAENVLFDPNANYTRPDLFAISEGDVKQLQQVHQRVVQKIKNDNSSLELVYHRGKRGIVSAAGRKYLPTLVISLRLLRRSGTRFPVEVFIASQEQYDEVVCEQILPTMNAVCIVLSGILGTNVVSRLEPFQLKSFAMLFSSFEQLLWLDASCFPIHDAIEIFQSKPFTHVGLVTWPDFWSSDPSRFFNTIASKPEPPVSERASTDGGQLLISKKTHAKTLLLASYYNYYGETHFYLLLSQSDVGGSDKETYLAAASVLDEPFYAVNEPIRSIGHRNANGHLDSSATVQYSPTEDYKLTNQGINHVKDANAGPIPHAFFLRTSYSKMSPVNLFDPSRNGSEEVSPIRGPDGKPSRAWTAEKETIDSLGGPDVEREYWSHVRWTVCTLEGLQFKDWKDKEGTCQQAKEYFDAVFAPKDRR
ncbi:uncharacterized protein PADG_06770 [Paracoccidioides brasiliensis Pb18]|uniref:Alpha-1,2-mannosyltransferase n=1 Tax=Paracoccidioides brasiliensis (strain Pb18) TaxID=502780 RepID=C1GHN4_PARBD|nr:uncharacterized protein PADG_06770 [Paracoccidioides brasiliensis Pb18]EEH50691.1 hypothetical protein PADG_06770 [Paracoccidioides brasiliensis Pb18]